MVRGFELGKDQDFARKIGNTHPELHSSVANTGPKPAADQPPPPQESPPPPPPPEPAPAPVLKRIAAVFDQSRFTTTYTEEASGQGLTYTWSVSIPDDKRCAEGFKPNFPNVDQAEWNHKDAAQGGTCNHDGGHNGPRGHPGTVTVVVGNADWTCTATYEGTEGDNGDPAGQGTQPSPCVRR
jgi:hypothetical protein